MNDFSAINADTIPVTEVPFADLDYIQVLDPNIAEKPPFYGLVLAA